MQYKQAKVTKSVENDEDYENDFEDYDDDFETSEDVKVAPPKQASAPLISSSKSYQQTITTVSAESKKPQSTTNGASAKASRAIGSSLSRSMVDPRSVRIQRILSSTVLDMKIERATLLNIPPSSKYDLYLSEIRSSDSRIKQMGVPTDLEIREIEVNTDEVATCDKEVQFCDGDDTKFLNILSSIRRKKQQTTGNESKEIPEQNNLYSLVSHDRVDSGTGSQLSEFLRRSSLAIENLLTETNMVKSSEKSTDRGHKMLTDKLSWKDAGKDGKFGANELLRNRHISFMKFSEFQTDVFLTIHPFSESDTEDLRPFKTLIAIWNVESFGGPVYVLEGSGDVNVACFSSSQSCFVIGGTADGCLYLWDLREPSSSHQDRDSIDLKIQRGVRKPSFSTHSLSISSETLDIPQEEDSIHSAKVLNIISPGGASSALASSVSTSSQFISLDQAGKVIFWLTQERRFVEESRDALRSSPWSKVTLVPTKAITLKALPSTRILSRAGRSKVSGESLLDDSSFLYSASEESFLLFPERDGKISKIVRMGEPSSPPIFSRAAATEIIELSGHRGASSQLAFSAQVTCMALRPALKNSKFPALLLVGRIDGSIDLFQLDQQYPILSWNVGNLLSSRSVENNIKKQKVVLLKWLPFNRSSFLAVDGNGTLHHFDLLMDVYKPFRSEPLGLEIKWRPGLIDISFPKSAVDTLHITCFDPKRKFKVCSRPINTSDMGQNAQASVVEDDALFESLSRSTIDAAQEKHIVLGRALGNDAK